MPTQVSLPFGFWGMKQDPRASGESTVNCFPELTPYTTTQAPLDAKQKLPPIYLRRAPGITSFASIGGTNQVRGIWEMQGVCYVVIGSSLYTLSILGTLSLLATGIAGTGFVRMTDNTACLVILVPGTTTCYTYCPAGGGFAQLTNAGFTQYGAFDCWFCDTFIVFLALNGRDFFNDDGQAVSGNNQITFVSAAVFPRELGTDLFVGMAVDHRCVLMFGERTSEGYQNAGNPTGSPFSSSPQTFMQIGIHPEAGLTPVLQDQSVFWIANDLTVRRRNGQTPQKVSNSAVEAALQNANLAGCYGLSFSIAGHLMVAFTLPQQQLTLVYDCTTQAWYKASSFGIGYWRPNVIFNWQGLQLVGDSQSGNVGFLDMTDFEEFGEPMTALLQTQSIYDAHNRLSHRRLEIVITPGEGASLTNSSKLSAFKSDDGGNKFDALPMRSLGTLGSYSMRAYWNNLGTARDRAYQFAVSDPTPLFAVDILAEIEGGRF